MRRQDENAVSNTAPGMRIYAVWFQEKQLVLENDPRSCLSEILSEHRRNEGAVEKMGKVWKQDSVPSQSKAHQFPRA